MSGRRLGDKNTVYGFALCDMRRLAIAVSQIPVILANDPAIRQLEIARLGESFQLVDGSVIQTVFAIARKTVLGDSDFIPRNQ